MHTVTDLPLALPSATPPHWGEALAVYLLRPMHGWQTIQPEQYAVLYAAICALARAIDAGHTQWALPKETYHVFCAARQHQPTLWQAGEQLLQYRLREQQQAPLLQAEHPFTVEPSSALIIYTMQGVAYLALHRHFYAESALAEAIQCFIVSAPTPIAAEQITLDSRTNQGQQQAILTALQHRLCLITGGPGTGKTFCLVQIIKTLLLQQPDLHIALAAPTGKAAARMQDVLQGEFSVQHIHAPHIEKAQTLHQLLGMGSKGLPRFNQKRPLRAQVVVIDEASMIDLQLAVYLFDAIALTTQLIILGDAHQLAAVDAGAVLADLTLQPMLQPYHVQLTESRRFDAQSALGQLAQAVLQGDWVNTLAQLHPVSAAESHPLQWTALDASQAVVQAQTVWQHVYAPYQPYVHQLVLVLQACLQQEPQSTLPSTLLNVLWETFNQYRILCAVKQGRYGVVAINRFVQQAIQNQLHAVAAQQVQLHSLLQTEGRFQCGDAVMVTRNLKQFGLANGDIGLCLPFLSEILVAEPPLALYFPHGSPILLRQLPLDDLELAFAMTIHKSQGSEYAQVAVVLGNTLPDADSTRDTPATPNILSRQLLYTAITRSKHHVHVYSSEAVLQYCVQHPALRYTGLNACLEGLSVYSTLVKAVE